MCSSRISSRLKETFFVNFSFEGLIITSSPSFAKSTKSFSYEINERKVGKQAFHRCRLRYQSSGRQRPPSAPLSCFRLCSRYQELASLHQLNIMPWFQRTSHQDCQCSPQRTSNGPFRPLEARIYRNISSEHWGWSVMSYRFFVCCRQS